MSSKGQLKREIKKCRLTIEEIERKRSRSQSALVQAILLQEEPSEMDVESMKYWRSPKWLSIK